jgi:hypothetical protein
MVRQLRKAFMMTKNAWLAILGFFLILVVLEASGLVAIPPLATFGGLLLILVVFVPRRAAYKWTIGLVAVMILPNLSVLIDTVSRDPTAVLLTEKNQLEFAYMGDKVNAVVVHNPPMHMRGSEGLPPWFLAAVNVLFLLAILVFAKRALAQELPGAASVSGKGE